MDANELAPDFTMFAAVAATERRRKNEYDAWMCVCIAQDLMNDIVVVIRQFFHVSHLYLLSPFNFNDNFTLIRCECTP